MSWENGWLSGLDKPSSVLGALTGKEPQLVKLFAYLGWTKVAGFMSNTLLIPIQDQFILKIVYRYNKNNETKGYMKYEMK